MKQENDDETFFKEGILVATKDLYLSTKNTSDLIPMV